MERIIQPLARITIAVSGIVFLIAVVSVPKSLTHPVHAFACGTACGSPGTGTCLSPCPPCQGPVDGPWTCGSQN